MNIVARAEGLTTRPREERGVAPRASSDPAGLFKRRAAPARAVPAVAGLVGGAAPFAGLPAAAIPGPSSGAFLVQSAASCVLGLAFVRVLDKAVQGLAPRSGGAGEEVSATRSAAHSPAAVRPAGAFAPVRSLGILALPGLHKLYTLFKGVPVLAPVPEDGASPFAATPGAYAFALGLFAVLGPTRLLAG